MVMLDNKPIVLLGFMGSGKSTLGKKLAGLIGWTFIDLDRFLEAQEGRSIPEIFDKSGEAYFRTIETVALEKALNSSFTVISIGGGAPCSSKNMELIKLRALSIYLKVTVPQLCFRLAYTSTPRPLLQGKSEVEKESFITELLGKREPYYLQSDMIIESDSISAEMILTRLELKTGKVEF
jgi:shikimate kinase